MTGIDMMVAALLKSAGVEPERVKEDVAAYARQLADKIASMDTALAALRTDQAVLINSMRDVVEIVEQLGMEHRNQTTVNGGPHGTRP